jgi:hypothetical protein
MDKNSPEKNKKREKTGEGDKLRIGRIPKKHDPVRRGSRDFPNQF